MSVEREELEKLTSRIVALSASNAMPEKVRKRLAGVVADLSIAAAEWQISEARAAKKAAAS